MNAQEYQKGVLQTESVPAKLEVNELALHAMLVMIDSVTALADQFKRKLFYGKAIDSEVSTRHLNAVGNLSMYLLQGLQHNPSSINNRLEGEARDELAELPPEIQGMNLDNINVRLMHSAIGVFTEGGELVELVRKQYETGKIDLVGFAEELGDVDWYKTIGNDASGVPEEVERRLNNQKLLDKKAGRYQKGAFTVQDAIERNTQKERTLLEAADQPAVREQA